MCTSAAASAAEATPAPEDVPEEIVEEIRKAAEVAEVRRTGLPGSTVSIFPFINTKSLMPTQGSSIAEICPPARSDKSSKNAVADTAR